MTREEMIWFEQLHDKRQKAWEVFSDVEYAGVFNSTIYKYSDTAHFVYELLQNADDAGATDVEFKLTKDCFQMVHNGTQRFTISNPETAKVDRNNGRYGHINSITAINFSSKVEFKKIMEQNKIGKFGVGFKAVYQYTNTPHIYDDGISFKIEHYIVPILIDGKGMEQKDKTIFVIPFDNPLSPEESYAQIEEKLKGLRNPQIFLHNIRTIRWSTETESGEFIQEIGQSYSFPFWNIKARFETYSYGTGLKQTLLKICSTTEIQGLGNEEIAIAYYIDKKGNVDTSTRGKLYCFFPTTENIGSCYIVHAPFMLTDSRQTLLGGNNINFPLFAAIEDLAARSLLVLREIGIQGKRHLLGDNIKKLTTLYIVPEFDKWNLSCSFHDRYKNVFDNENVFLSSNGDYLKAEEAVWAKESIRAFISTNQLRELTSKRDFVLCSCNNYLNEVKGCGSILELDDKKLSQCLSTAFMKKQNNEWLDQFYYYLIENNLTTDGDGIGKVGLFRFEPVFKTDAGDFISAFDEEDKLQLFLATDGITTPQNTVNQELLNQSANYKQLVDSYKIDGADIFDYIRTKIKEDQTQWSQKAINDFLAVVINYWSQGNDDNKNKLKKKLKSLVFVGRSILLPQKLYYRNLNCLYTGSKPFENYLEAAKQGGLLAIDKENFINKNHERDRKEKLLNNLATYCTLVRDYYHTAIEKIGAETYEEFVQWLSLPTYPHVIEKNDVSLSEEERNIYIPGFKKKTKTVVTLDQLSNVISAIESSADKKDISHFIWESLCSHLRDNNDKDSSLFDNDYTQYKYLNEINKHDWQGSSLKSLLLDKRWIFLNNHLVAPTQGLTKEDLGAAGYEQNEDLLRHLEIPSRDEIQENLAEEEAKSASSIEEKARGLQKQYSFEELTAIFEFIFKKKRSANAQRLVDVTDDDNTDVAEDIYEYSLQEQLNSSERYSYRWFKRLIDLESQLSGVTDEEKKTQTLKRTFTHVLFPVGEDVIVLDGTSNYLPQSIEEIDDLEVCFNKRNGSVTKLSFDAVSVKDDILTLKVRKRQQHDVDQLRKDIHSIFNAEISVERPIELLKSWKSLIYQMGFGDGTSLRDNLRRDIKFIFGPPGTGKTYTLANRILALMSEDAPKRILVLAPTNKACDVLTEKVIELSHKDTSWLFRFAKTMSDNIDEDYVLYRDSAIPEHACIVTTIARYAYDGCQNGVLRDFDWDYVIIDEASMIPLYQIVVPLYNNHSRNIIVAGDPLQIQPIVQCDAGKNENIYTMVELNDFANPATEPTGFEIESLDTQWRSIPVIGELYSKFSYGGKLNHHRSDKDRKIIDMGLGERPLNIIRFPVNKESLYTSHRIKKSNVQIYSVILMVETLKYITRHIAMTSPDQCVSIGVVGPYVAEIQAISKMYEQLGNHYANIKIVFGSAHGFQGDQCDIMFAVLNPPASGLKRHPEKTLINNHNIINVSISRASDYLFILIPNQDYENYDNLKEVKNLSHLMITLDGKMYSHNNIEELIFSHKNEIETNTFVTSHQMTNVYSEFSKKYEIRIDEEAMDIQVNSNK